MCGRDTGAVQWQPESCSAPCSDSGCSTSWAPTAPSSSRRPTTSSQTARTWAPAPGARRGAQIPWPGSWSAHRATPTITHIRYKLLVSPSHRAENNIKKNNKQLNLNKYCTHSPITFVISDNWDYIREITVVSQLIAKRCFVAPQYITQQPPQRLLPQPEETIPPRPVIEEAEDEFGEEPAYSPSPSPLSPPPPQPQRPQPSPSPVPAFRPERPLPILPTPTPEQNYVSPVRPQVCTN